MNRKEGVCFYINYLCIDFRLLGRGFRIHKLLEKLCSTFTTFFHSYNFALEVWLYLYRIT